MHIKKSHPFYGSSKWKKTRADFLRIKHYVCEICGKPANYVHHIDPLKDEDYFVNYEKCYGYSNLQALCMDCHNKQPGHFMDKANRQAIAEGYSVNMITGEIEVAPPSGWCKK